MFYRVSRVILPAAVVIGVAWTLWSRAPVAGQPSGAAQGSGAEVVRYYGTASCSSMACHHFNGPEGSFRSEYSTWAGGDKHSKAFTVLYNDRSARIVKNLEGVSPDIIKGKPATAQEYCLRCHATHTGEWSAKDDRMLGTGERFSLADGVGCEACHGPSDKYLTEHYLDGFKGKSAKDKEKDYGLRDTKTLSTRAKMCAECHVGTDETKGHARTGSKEVNHDLIAAGHPRLNFELAAYHGIMHKHWSDDAEKSRHPDFYARIWLIGQLANARSAVELLAVRAENGEKKFEDKGWRPWPEFAEYACYACHQDLQVKKPEELADKYKNRKPGTFPFGTWYLAALDSPLTGDPGGLIPQSILTSKGKLKGLMERPAPPAKEVAVLARQMTKDLDEVMTALDKKQLDPVALRRVLVKYADLGKTRAGELSWDEATQIYLALAALAQGRTDLKVDTLTPGAGRDELLAIKNRLREAFPKAGYDSPKNYNPTAKDKATMRNLSEEFDAVLNKLGK